MFPQLKALIDALKIPVEKFPFSEAMDPYEVEVPYSKPRMVTLDPPVDVRSPLRVAVVLVMVEAAWLPTPGVTAELMRTLLY